MYKKGYPCNKKIPILLRLVKTIAGDGSQPAK